MMKALKLSLIASSALLTIGVPCFAADAPAASAPQVQTKPADNAANGQENENDDVEVVELDIEEENPVASYPFGQPVIKQDGSKWTATLPGRELKIQSQWTAEPNFRVEANGEGQYGGAASLTSVKKPESGTIAAPVVSLLVYVYEPKSMKLDTTNPQDVIKMLIDDPAERAREAGQIVKVDKSSGKADKTLGVIEDARRKITLAEKVQKPKAGTKIEEGKQPELETTEEVWQTQFYRILIGKDFVVLGLVLGGADVPEKDAQAFLDNISLSAAATAQPAADVKK